MRGPGWSRMPSSACLPCASHSLSLPQASWLALVTTTEAERPSRPGFRTQTSSWLLQHSVVAGRRFRWPSFPALLCLIGSRWWRLGGMVLIEKIKTWAKQGKGRDKRGRPLEFYGFLDSFPDGSIGKEPSYNAGDAGTIPWSWRSAGEGIGYPL